ncbi:hypothetical protein ACX12M_02760 [Cellulosimicrobium cellulans]
MTTPTTTARPRVLTAAFWQAAGARALRTVLVAALPFLAPLIGGDWAAVGQAGLAFAFAAVASLATSLASLPELGTTRSRWAALLDRSVRTFGQTLAASIGSALVWSDVDWRLALVQAATAAVTTAILAIVEQLPETVPAIEAEPDADGVHDITWIVDTAAPAGYEVPEVSAAKDEVAAAVRDLLEYHLDDVETVYATPRDPIHEADVIVEKLLTLGWRPTA